jgi:uncharacterized protein with GYD domain
MTLYGTSRMSLHFSLRGINNWNSRIRIGAREKRPQAGGGSAMPVFVMLTKLTDQGANTINRDPHRIKEVNKDVEKLGAKVLAQYALLGEYDFLNILEAPNEETVIHISLKLASRGTLRIQTMAALSIDDFIRAAQ